MERQKHSNVPHIQSFRAANCANDHCLVVAKVRVRVAVKQSSHRNHFDISTRFADLEELGIEVDIINAWETTSQNIKVLAMSRSCCCCYYYY
jgi:hypothetical protein